MVQLAIRCHPCVPVSVDEIERWLERQVAQLRAGVPHATVRLSRLTQSGPSSDLYIGWLVELELAQGDPLLGGRGSPNRLGTCGCLAFSRRSWRRVRLGGTGERRKRRLR
jgi:hypothetical protein